MFNNILQFLVEIPIRITSDLTEVPKKIWEWACGLNESSQQELNSERLATIRRIDWVKKHPNADSLDLCGVQGWQMVSKLGEFKEGDLAVYIEIDSIVPETPDFEFLRKTKFRVKTCRLRGEVSQGILFPLSILKNSEGRKAGENVTKEIGVIKYEKPLPKGSRAVGRFCKDCCITDEDRWQNNPDFKDFIDEEEIVITTKEDGTSGTFKKENGKLEGFSRKLQVNISDPSESVYAKIANELKDKLPDGYIVQGEIVGPSIQGNPAGYPTVRFKAFQVFDLERKVYISSKEFFEFCKKYDIPTVDILYQGIFFKDDWKKLLDMAEDNKYINGKIAEGIVVRPWGTESSKGRRPSSVKIVSNKYLLKHGE